MTQSPIVDLVPGNDTLITELPVTLDAGSGYTSYSWQDNSTGTTFEVNEYGWYYVIVAGPNGCTTKDSAFVRSAVSVESMLIQNGALKIYPNPVKEVLNIVLNTDEAFDTSIELHNMLGELVYKENFKHTGYSEQKIKVHNLTPGTYTMHMIIDRTAFVTLIIVQ